MKIFLQDARKWIWDKINKFFDNAIVNNPQIASILLLTLLSCCYDDNIVDTITNTKARMLLQKNQMNSFEKQLSEIWIATQNLAFLFKEFSKNQESKPSSNKIDNAYKTWSNLKKNWEANFPTNYSYVSKFPGKKEKKKCFYIKKLFTKFEYEFKCRINKRFDEKIFNKLENCYKNYYLKKQSCKPTLPNPQEITELNNIINAFYLEISRIEDNL